MIAALATKPTRSARGARASFARSQQRGVAQRRSEPLLRTRDLDLLAWVAEQYAARVDQIGVLIGCGPRTVQRTLARLRAAGMVETFRLLADQPAWVTPTARGLRACNSPFGVWQPRLSLIAHVAAVNDVRLHVQARDPQAQWLPERLLASSAQTVAIISPTQSCSQTSGA